MVGKLVVKPTFHWEVNVDEFENKKVGDVLVSPLILTNGLGDFKNQWELKLYPKGFRESERGFLSLFIFNRSSNEISATINISILNQETLRYEKCYTMKNSLFKTQKLLNQWGYMKFAEESYVMDPRNNLIKDNKLIISCSIIFENCILENEFMEDELNSDLIKSKRPSKRIKLLDDFEKLLTDKELSDVTITAPDGKSFYLHKCILSAHSIVFERMFKIEMKEKNQNTVKIEDIQYDVLEELFRFIYTGKISDRAVKIINELFIAAEKYCIESLKELCEDIMTNNLDNDNAMDYLKFAMMTHAEKLEFEAIKYVSFHIDDFINKQDFDDFGSQNPKVLLKIMKKLRNV